MGAVIFWALAVIGIGVVATRRGKGRPAWERAALQLGLRYGAGAIQGTIGRFDVVIDANCTRHQSGTRCWVRNHDIPPSLRMGKEDLPSWVPKAVGGQDIQTGDQDFDEQVRVRGDTAEVLAVLDATTRRQIQRDLIAWGGEVGDSAVWCEVGESLESEARLVAWAHDLIELGRRLILNQADLPEKLAKNAQTDPDSAVRSKNLLVLQRRFPDSEWARQASRALLKVDSPHLRLEAAGYLGEEGRDTVKALAENGRIDRAIRCEALQQLARLAPESSVATFERALSAHDSRVRHIAIEACGALRNRAVVPQLLALMDVADSKTLLALAKTLGQIGDPAAEAGLIRSLDCDSTPVRIAVAEALGRLGTVAAVEPLQSCMKGLLTDGDLKRAALVAVRSIQSRLGDVEAGRLSVSDLSKEEGALSLPSDEGKLSLPEGEGEAEPEKGTGLR